MCTYVALVVRQPKISGVSGGTESPVLAIGRNRLREGVVGIGVYGRQLVRKVAEKHKQDDDCSGGGYIKDHGSPPTHPGWMG